jgi:type IV secretory pathway TrbL component
MNMTLYVGIFMIIFDNYNLDATVIERNTFDNS